MRARRQAGGAITSLVLGCALGTVGCEPARHPPLLLSPETMRARVKTICILGVDSEVALPDGAERMSRIADALRRALEAEGYTVVQPSEVLETAQGVLESLGGAYDPHTGERDWNRDRALRRAAHQALFDRHACDAMLRGRLVAVQAPWKSGTATWDGTTQDMGGQGYEYGWVAALSLYVEMHDMQEAPLYFSTGGIEVLARLTRDWSSTQRVLVEPGLLLVDQSRIEGAVALALQGLWPEKVPNPPADLPGSRWERIEALGAVP